MRSIFCGACILLLSGSIEAKEKKFKEPPPVYVNTRSFAASCDAVWTAAMPLLTEMGLAPQSMDRNGGFASLKWTKASMGGLAIRSNDDVKQFTTDSGFLIYEFRPETGTLLITPDSVGCRTQLKLSFTALRGRIFTAGRQWETLESNNFLEQTLLNKIEVALQNPNAAPAQPTATSVSTPSATVTINSTPPGGDIEIDGRFVGSTPSKFELPPGKHQIRVRKTGHRDWQRDLDLLTAANIALAAELVPGENEKPATLPADATVTTASLPSAKSASNAEAIREPSSSPPSTAASAASPQKMGDPLKIVCPERFSEVPFSSSRPNRKTLACGEEVSPVSQSGQWMRVKTKDGIEGNVDARFIGK